MGDKELTLSPAFGLYMHTKLSNPHYPPEIQAECTLINFTVTESGLEDQLLSLVVTIMNRVFKKKSHRSLHFHKVQLQKKLKPFKWNHANPARTESTRSPTMFLTKQGFLVADNPERGERI